MLDFTARSLICVEVSDAMATTVQDSSDLNTTQTVNAEQDAVSRLQEAGNQEVLVVPDEQLSGNQQVQTGITNTVKDNEQVNGNANVDNEEDDSDDSFEEFMDDDSDDETASEARRTMRKKQKKTKKDDKKITVPMILHCIDSDLDITLLLRALVSQAVRFHSNSAARSAITTGQLVDLGGK